MADLTTITNVKNSLNLTVSTAQSDALLGRLISAFSAWFINQVNREAILQAIYIEKRNGKGTQTIVTKQYPIISVSAVTVGNVSIPASPDGVQPGFVFDDYEIALIGYQFKRGYGNVKLTYTAGYESVPLDIEAAVIDQVIFEYKRLPNLGTTSQGTPTAGIQTSWSQRDLAPGVQSVINSYRNRTLVGL